MTVRLQLFALLAVAAFAASATAPLFFEGQLTDEATERPIPGTYEMETYLSLAPDGEAVTAKDRQTVTTDVSGYYSAKAPFDAAGLVLSNDTVCLNVAFYDSQKGALVTRLPSQRIGYAPYALHAREADRMQTRAARATALAVASFAGAGTFAATDALDVRGTLLVTNAVALTGVVAAEGVVGSLQLGTLGSDLLSRDAGGDALAVCSRTADAALSFTAKADGVVELRLVTPAGEGSCAVTVTKGGETLVSCADGATGGAVRRYAWPVRAGETLAATAAWSGEGEAALETNVRYFGIGK